MAQPPSYDASINNPGYHTSPPQQGAYPPPQDGAYPPPQQGAYPPQQVCAYPPPQQGAYPPPPQGAAYPPPQQGNYAQQSPSEPYSYPGKQEEEAGFNVENGDKEMMGIINFDNKSIRLSKFFYV